MVSHPKAIAIARRNDILDAVSQQCGMPAETLTLLPDETFESKEHPGALCFTVLHSSGFYGVFAPPDEKGEYGKFVAAAL